MWTRLPNELARSLRPLLLFAVLFIHFSMAIPHVNPSSGQDATVKNFLPMPFTTIHDPLPARDSIYIWSSLFAGVGSGALASVICAPLDVIRTQIQVYGEVVAGRKPRDIGMVQVLRDIIRTEGVKGCFRGLGATLITVPFFWGVYCE
jgi:hypothetical protein